MPQVRQAELVQRLDCFFAQHSPHACDGPMDRAHLIAKQRIKRELRGQEDLMDQAVWHPAVWVWACRRHHGDFDNKRMRFGRGDVPAQVEAYAEALGLTWSLDADFGPA